MNRQQKRFQKRQEKKDSKKVFNPKDILIGSSTYYWNPIDFFGSLSDSQSSNMKKWLKEGNVYLSTGSESRIETQIGWNEERNGYFFFRRPNQEVQVPDFVKKIEEMGGLIMKMGVPNDQTHFNGDGQNEWCVPSKLVLDKYGLVEVDGSLEWKEKVA